MALRVWQVADSDHPPAVLLPATGKTASDWDQIAAGLSADREVIAADLRGHGASSWPGAYGLGLFAADVIALLDHLGPGPVDLAGHSLGGLVACRVAADRPDLVRRLVLEDIGMPHPREPGMPARPDGELPFDWQMVGQVRPQIDNPDPAWPEIISRITAPTLLVAGGAASPIPQHHIAELAAALPDARLITIEAGHLVHATEPAAFLAAVRAFLTAPPS
ncbi:alpha/beta fold hydrolase [Actinoplanes sp. DH11]|uniref:alpha/beta fold hydrolase n=1 Tax=Actinoplanes sp. DH11 TaxID=2857011 RepID=UPI001E3F48D5|nr:alpha/beta hydrolase [Actinoplanes sp. DH11]